MKVRRDGWKSTGRALLRTLWMVGLVWGLVGCNQDRAISVKSMNTGLAALKRGDTNSAIESLEKASYDDPTYADPPYYMGQIYHQKFSQLEDAERQYEEALKRDPENAQFGYRLGTVQGEMGKHKDAVSTLRQVVTTEPKFAEAWFRMGLSQLALKEYRPAVESFMESIESNPKMQIGKDGPRGSHYHALGDLYLRFSLDDKALQVYEDGIKFNPDAPRLQHGLGVAYLKAEKYEEAASEFEKALKQRSPPASAYFNLAVAQQKLGDKKAAIKTLEEFIGRADQSADAARVQAAFGVQEKLREELEGKKPAPE